MKASVLTPTTSVTMVSGQKPSRIPGAKELGAAFTASHDGATSVSIGLPYASAQILFTAIERAGVFEPGAVRDKVFGGSFPGTTMGDVTYGTFYPDNPGIAHVPLLALQWIDSKRVVVFPAEVLAADKLRCSSPGIRGN